MPIPDLPASGVQGIDDAPPLDPSAHLRTLLDVAALAASAYR
jgi:hypothetical protein